MIWNLFFGEYLYFVEYEFIFYILDEDDMYNCVDELYKECIYLIVIYENILKKYGFMKIDIYVDFSYEKFNNMSERIFFVVRK